MRRCGLYRSVEPSAQGEGQSKDSAPISPVYFVPTALNKYIVWLAENGSGQPRLAVANTPAPPILPHETIYGKLHTQSPSLHDKLWSWHSGKLHVCDAATHMCNYMYFIAAASLRGVSLSRLIALIFSSARHPARCSALQILKLLGLLTQTVLGVQPHV